MEVRNRQQKNKYNTCAMGINSICNINQDKEIVNGSSKQMFFSMGLVREGLLLFLGRVREKALQISGSQDFKRKQE